MPEGHAVEFFIGSDCELPACEWMDSAAVACATRDDYASYPILFSGDSSPWRETADWLARPVLARLDSDLLGGTSGARCPVLEGAALS